MSKKDYLEKVKGERTLLEKIMSYIPGYRGYKEKELRRESDRLIRMEVVNRLKAAKMDFRRALANLSTTQKLVGDDAYRLEAFNARIDRVTQRIDKAVAGYAGMFDAVKVKEDKLDAVIRHDLSLIEKAEAIKAGVKNSNQIEAGTEEWRAAVDAVIAEIEALDKLVDERANILRGIGGEA
ncbi:MAG: hypothetical protein N3E52_06930 [Candidatus Bathyarchaeota archaeon]|nr:hypothetical protein [Candidatus Bathyarchaeota archaeon]